MAEQFIKKEEIDNAKNNDNTNTTLTSHTNVSSSSAQTIAGENMASSEKANKEMDEIISTVLPDGQLQDFTPKHSSPTTQSKNMNMNNKDNNKAIRLSKMESLLCQSQDILTNYFTANFVREHGIPYYIFNEAKAIIFMSYWKAGLVIGGVYGNGILLSRLNNQWSGPCAITLGACEIGLEIGIEKLDCILIINHENILKYFENKGVLALGADASIALGPFGKDLNMITQGTDSIFTYSFAKGGYLGISFESGIISVSNDCNKEYYGKPVVANEIIYNKIDIPQNKFYLSLIHSLDKFNLNKSTNTNNMIINSNNNTTANINTNDMATINTNTNTNTSTIIPHNDDINDKRSATHDINM